MNEARLTAIIKKHSPQAKVNALLTFNRNINDGLKLVGKARRSKGTAEDKEQCIRKAMEEIYDQFHYVAEPIMLCPMETCLILYQIRWNLFDQGISLRMFKVKENQEFYLDFDHSLDKLLSRIAAEQQRRAKKITEYLRILKFLPCLENEISHQESINNGLKFKWTALALSLMVTFFIATGLNSLQVVIPGIALSVIVYIVTSFLTNGDANSDAIPGGFNQRYNYLSKRTRRSIKTHCLQTLEAIVRENKWRFPTTLTQAQKLKPRCLDKIMSLANPTTQISSADAAHDQLALS